MCLFTAKRHTVNNSHYTCLSKVAGGSDLKFKRKQEAHLSQRGRAILRVIEYFGKSLKVNRNDTLAYGIGPCKSFYYSTVMMSLSYRFWDIQRHIVAWPWNMGYGHSRSLKTAPFDRLFLFVFHSNYMAISCNIFDIKRNIGRKSWFFHAPWIRRPFRAPLSELCYKICHGKTKMVWLPNGEKVWGYGYSFWHNTQSDGQQDGQTDRHRTTAEAALVHSIARKKNCWCQLFCPTPQKSVHSAAQVTQSRRRHWSRRLDARVPTASVGQISGDRTVQAPGFDQIYGGLVVRPTAGWLPLDGRAYRIVRRAVVVDAIVSVATYYCVKYGADRSTVRVSMQSSSPIHSSACRDATDCDNYRSVHRRRSS